MPILLGVSPGHTATVCHDQGLPGVAEAQWLSTVGALP
jgi:hypothetical protein